MSKSQSVLDALADAETLRIIMTTDHPQGDYLYYADDMTDPDFATAWALVAAHAAFRAVPGLRDTEHT